MNRAVGKGSVAIASPTIWRIGSCRAVFSRKMRKERTTGRLNILPVLLPNGLYNEAVCSDIYKKAAARIGLRL